MTQPDFYRVIMKQTGMIKYDVTRIVKVVFDGIREAITTGESLAIPGVGTIYPHYNESARGGKNRVTLKFRPSKHMESKLTNSLTEMFGDDTESIEDSLQL